MCRELSDVSFEQIIHSFPLKYQKHSVCLARLFVYSKINKCFCMRKNRLFCLFISLVFTIGASAQLVEKVREFLGDDTLKTHSVIRSDSDSANIADMKRELEAARLNEANMRMEMEQLKLQVYAADSVKLAQQKLRIDSLRKFTQGVPVVVEGNPAED